MAHVCKTYITSFCDESFVCEIVLNEGVVYVLCSVIHKLWSYFCKVSVAFSVAHTECALLSLVIHCLVNENGACSLKLCTSFPLTDSENVTAFCFHFQVLTNLEAEQEYLLESVRKLQEEKSKFLQYLKSEMNIDITKTESDDVSMNVAES